MPQETAESTPPPELDSTLRRLAQGRKVSGRYRLEEMVGRGAMGVVWRAQDEMLDRPVALKFLAELLIHDPMALDDLKRETRRALELTHHNIVRVYDLVEDDAQDLACLAMEFFPGETLTRLRLREPNRFFDPDRIASWIGQLCDAMHYAHEKVQVVHRDLKPQNLMLDEKGEIKITDFGVARVASDSLTRVSVGKVSGTPCYMSPQQARGETPLPSDDVYSIGATLYELLTGRPPFWQGDVTYQLENVAPATIRDRRKELTGVDSRISSSWEETVAACLAKDASRRPRGAREIAERLGVVLPSSRLGRSPASFPPMTPPPSSQVATMRMEEMTMRGIPAPSGDDVQATLQARTALEGNSASRPIASAVESATLAGGDSRSIPGDGTSAIPPPPRPPPSGWAPLPPPGSLKHAGWASLPSRQPGGPVAPSLPPSIALPPPPPPLPLLPPQRAGVPLWVWVCALGFVFAGVAFFVGALVRHQFGRESDGSFALSAPGQRAPKTFVVPVDYPSIQNAIDVAQRGDTVQVRAGTYRESLTLKEGLHLLGESASNCRIEVPPGAACALFLRGGRDTVIENFTIDGGGMADPNVFSVGFDIAEDPAGATAREVAPDSPAARAGITSGARILSVDGQIVEEAAEAQYLIARNAVARDVTIQFEQGGTTRTATMRTERRPLASVWPDGVVLSNAEVAITNCVIQRFGGIGLLVYGARTKGTVERCKFLDGAENGCSLIRTSSDLKITNNEFRGNGGAGLRLESASSVITGNLATGNKSVGLHVSGRSANPTLRNNTCTKNEKSGMYFVDGAGGTAEDNTCSENTDCGFFVTGAGTAPTLRGNRVRANQKNGMLFTQGASGRVERNICEQNAWPALCAAGSGTTPAFINNRAVENKQSGIYFNSGAGGSAEQNYCANNGDVGIGINGEGTSPRLISNEIRDNADSGILFTSNARGTAERNTCRGNKSNGITVTGGSVAMISENTSVGNTLHGISIAAGASGTFSGNQCDENGDSGTAIFSAGTSPTLTGNKARRNQHYGIYFGNGAGGNATDNTCEYNTLSGIGVANAGTAPSISGNSLNHNQKYGLEVFNGAQPRVGRNSFLRNVKGDRM